MGMGTTMFWAVIISAIIIYPIFWAIKKGYSRKWDEE